jgi:hypothetical protein
MRPVLVVVGYVSGQYLIEMSTTEDEHPIQTLTADRPDKALSECVGSRRPDRGPDDADALGTEDLVEDGGELESGT